MISVFEKMSEEDTKKVITNLNCRKNIFKKNKTILSNLENIDQICIVLSGTAIITKYDYYGNRIIIEHLQKNSVFGKTFSSNDNSSIIVEATEDCEVLFLDYLTFIEKIAKNTIYSTIIDNILKILSSKIENSNNRIEILTNRTIREKLLNYFKIMAKGNMNNTFTLPFTFADLADYLAIDRCAMMREIKYLKEEKIIKCDKRKITLYVY